MEKMKPIIFSTPMVQAILDGKKTQTRRVVIPQPGKDDPNIRYCTIEGFQCAPPGDEIWADTDEGESFKVKPKYNIGDILWVRETWRVSLVGINGSDEWANIVYKCGENKSVDIHSTEKSLFYTSKANWQSPLFLPREAARIFLKVESVRFERLQDISPEDAVSEGAVNRPHYIRYGGEPCLVDHNRYREEYASLWNSLNAKRGYSWEKNPWVFAYTFKKIDMGGE